MNDRNYDSQPELVRPEIGKAFQFVNTRGIEHRNDPDFFSKAHLYRTAILRRSGECVALLGVVDSNTETGVMFKIRNNGRVTFANDSELVDFVL